MTKLKALQILKNYGATKISLLKDLDSGSYLVEKKITVSIDIQKKLFTNEIAVHKQLDHRYIIKFLDQVDAETFLMEYAPGGSVEQLLQKDPAAILTYRQLQQFVMGVMYLHDLGYVHNDLKTSNLLLDDEKRVKLIDFAFAGKIGETFSEDFPDYFIIGTDHYRKNLTARNAINCVQNDLYSIGIVLYRIFAKPGCLEAVNAACIENLLIRSIVKRCLNEQFNSAKEILDILSEAK